MMKEGKMGGLHDMHRVIQTPPPGKHLNTGPQPRCHPPHHRPLGRLLAGPHLHSHAEQRVAPAAGGVEHVVRRAAALFPSEELRQGLLLTGHRHLGQAANLENGEGVDNDSPDGGFGVQAPVMVYGLFEFRLITLGGAGSQIVIWNT